LERRPFKVKGMGLCPTPHQGSALDPQGAMRPLTPAVARRHAGTILGMLHKMA